MSFASNPRVRQAAVASLGLAVSIVSLFLVARSVKLEDAAHTLASASVGPLVLALVVMLVALGGRGCGFGECAAREGGEDQRRERGAADCTNRHDDLRRGNMTSSYERPALRFPSR